MTMLRPFRTLDEAWYWGSGGTPTGREVETCDGGWYVLHGRSTPAGAELSHVGIGPDGRPRGVPGWPPQSRLKQQWVWAIPAGASYPEICDGEDPVPRLFEVEYHRDAPAAPTQRMKVCCLEDRLAANVHDRISDHSCHWVMRRYAAVRAGVPRHQWQWQHVRWRV